MCHTRLDDVRYRLSSIYVSYMVNEGTISASSHRFSLTVGTQLLP